LASCEKEEFFSEKGLNEENLVNGGSGFATTQENSVGLEVLTE